MSLNDDLEKIRAEKQEWQTLLDSPQWQKLKYGVEAQITGRRTGLDDLRPTSLDALIMAGSSMSEISGMKTVLTWPQIIIDQLALQERLLLEKINESA